MDKKMTRAARRRKQRNRRILLTVALMMLVAVVSIGGTMAWLSATTNTVTNTFSPSNIGLTLTETESGNNFNFKIVPGTTGKKNPTVKIENDVAAYLFVKVDQSWSKTFGTGDKAVTYTLGSFIDYTLNLTGWTQGTGTGENGNGIPTDVWYIIVEADAPVKEWNLLVNNQVTYKNTVTKGDMDNLATLTADTYPKLSFTAYAIQKDGFDNVGAAWNAIGN